MVAPCRIGDRLVGPGQPCFVIAEAGVNHNGDPSVAKRLIDVAAAAGADAVKFQTFRAETLASPGAAKAGYQTRTTGAGSQLEMLRQYELPPDVFRELMVHCGARGIRFLSTPFDEESADLLDALGVPAFKVGSGEVTNLPFLHHVARKGRPVILSTGMSTLDEVAAAVAALEEGGQGELVLLHCVSNYPADPADANLRAMSTMAAAFDVPIGYSDHTLGVEVALAAVALGACVIEKHFTLDRRLPGPDHRASLVPDELGVLVRGVRAVEMALGHGRKEPAPAEIETAAAVRRSLVAACDIRKGALLSEAIIAIRRPGTGLPPAMRRALVGRRTNRDVPAGTLLTLEMLE